MIPLRVVRTTIQYRDLQGNEVTLDYENIHHRNETVYGLSDPWVLSRFTATRAKWAFDLRAGLTLPFGRTEEDPFEAAARGESHEHIQLGTGTVNPVIGFGFRRSTTPVSFDAWGIAALGLYENSKGYQPGHRFGAGVGATFRAGQARPWTLRAGVEAQEEEAERWGGVVHESDGNRGRKDVLLEAAVSRRMADGWSFNATLKAPVYSRVVGGQLDYPAILELGWSRTFGLHAHAGPDGDDEHHGEEGSAAAPGAPAPLPPGDAPAAILDLEAVVAAGEDAELAPVAGKLTVFDFWAAWCLPCRELDRLLKDLLAEDPRLAVRKVNIIDWDSPIARRYLSAVPALPYVKVFGPDGKILFDRTGDPEGIVEAIRRALSAER